MVKYYCDHCGEELDCASNELSLDELFRDGDRWVGEDCIMCDDCYDLRQKLHMELDKKFFHIEK